MSLHKYNPPLHTDLQYGDMLVGLSLWRGGITVHFGYRCQAVPFVHKYRGGWHFRRPRTTSECRDLALARTREARQDPEAYGPGIRKRPLRHSYDDMPRGRRGRSWKHQKKDHQHATQ